MTRATGMPGASSSPSSTWRDTTTPANGARTAARSQRTRPTSAAARAWACWDSAVSSSMRLTLPAACSCRTLSTLYSWSASAVRAASSSAARMSRSCSTTSPPAGTASPLAAPSATTGPLSWAPRSAARTGATGPAIS